MNEQFALSQYTSIEEDGDYIMIYGYDEAGKRVKGICDSLPYSGLFLNPGIPDHPAATGWKDVHGQPLIEATGGCQKLAGIKSKLRSLKKDNIRVYGDIQNNFKYINSLSFADGDAAIPHDFSKVKIFNFDIETYSNEGFPEPEIAPDPVVSISICYNRRIYVLALKDYNMEKDFGQAVHFRKCKDEAELLERFIQLFVKIDPDVITGWNVEFFDVPYIVKRISRVLGKREAERLSPFKMIKDRKRTVNGRNFFSCRILGRNIMDGIAMYKRFTYKEQESYSLNHISHVELDEEKVDYVDMGYANLTELYDKDFDTFIDYNIKDVLLVEGINRKLNLMEISVSIAYEAGVNFADIFFPVRVWDAKIYRYLHKRRIALDPRVKTQKTHYPGGYVKAPQVGLHDWIVSYDLTSLYPHLIMTLNISPDMLQNSVMREDLDIDDIVQNGIAEGIKDKCAENNLCIGANGYYFSKAKRGFLSALMVDMYKGRKTIKDNMLKAMQAGEDKTKIAAMDSQQQAIKFLLNSVSGGLGNAYFRWHDERAVATITLTGQLSIKWVEHKINQYLNKILGTDKDYVVAIDTDSVYLNLSQIVKRFIKDTDTQAIVDKLIHFGEAKIQPVIDEAYRELCEDELRAFENKLSMKREVIADKGVWCAKKMYAMHIYDEEGVRYTETDGKWKIKGLLAIKSIVPQACKDAALKALKLAMYSSKAKLRRFITEFSDQFSKMEIEDIAFPRGVKGLDKYAGKTKSIPIHVRGALLYNQLLDRYDLEHKYERIYNGDKIKFVYLQKPNPTGSHVIAMKNYWPEEFGLDQYVDNEIQFTKGFLSVINQFLLPMGIDPEQSHSIEDVFF